MTKEEFKENIEGIFIELIETKKAELLIGSYYIRLYKFHEEISDYIITLYDYLEQSGFTNLFIDYWSIDENTYRELSKSDIVNIKKMGIYDVTIYFNDPDNIIEYETYRGRRRYNESKFVDNDELNELLDKIAEYGIESISDIENKRLKIFSENDKSIIELIDKMGDVTSQFKTLNMKMRELSSEGEDGKYLMVDWMKLNTEMVKLEREIQSHGIQLGDHRLTRLMKKERPDVYGDIHESKFENIKDIITDIDGILVELKDLGIPYKISPIDDIKVKMVSLGKEEIAIDISFKDLDKSSTIISTLIDYMAARNFKLLPIRNLYTHSGLRDFNTFDELLSFYDKFTNQKVFLRNRNLYRLVFENMDKLVSESLPKQQTVDQLKKLRKLTKGIDIGDRISDMNKQGANIDYIKNPIDTGIESFEDYEKKNKKFIPSWNLKHLLGPLDHSKKKKRKKNG
jgi:hypothetical protein